MDVSNDPFPRDEVTGLAAFENLEPVSALNVMPEPAPEPDPAAQPAPRTFNRPIGVAPAPGPGDRVDQTEILNLDSTEQVGDEPERDSYGWDEDEATSMFNPAQFRPSLSEQPVQQAAALEMDWDEEEPPTRMRDDMPFLPALGGGAQSRIDWEADDVGRDHGASYEGATYDELATAGYPPSDVPIPAPPVGRPSPFPPASATSGAYLPPIAAPVPPIARGGAPSPFTETSAGLQEAIRPARPPWMLVAAGAAIAVVLLLIGRALFSSSPDATVTVTTTPSDARVYIDGRPVSGTGSPFSANELKAGPHELVVQKDGFVEHRTTFNLEDGETRALPPVQLAAQKVETGLAINSMPSGASIMIDGTALGKVTPAKLTDVTPGTHKLQLQLAGHNDFELQVLVPDNGVLQLPTAELTAAAAPSKKAERVERAEPREPREHREPVASDEPKPKRIVKAEPEPMAAAPVVREPAAPKGGAGGILRLNSRPWSQVYVDGRLVGNTPQMGLPLSQGNHSIRLVNAQMGLTKTFSVSIKTGQMVTKVVNLVE
ncbi:MAG TPA: PEGA domain-containing protein [Polyangiales bacterium]|nr:PEGA domain-containing protein [Polyangiales bacterium]